MQVCIQDDVSKKTAFRSLYTPNLLFFKGKMKEQNLSSPQIQLLQPTLILQLFATVQQHIE